MPPLAPGQITSVSPATAVTGQATGTITLAGAPNGDGTHFQAAFAQDGQCNTQRVGASLLATGDITIPSITFIYQAMYYVCWSTDNGATWVQQTSPNCKLEVTGGMHAPS
jgi:hypothetical protein